jgi:hypothetical protein
MKIAIMALATAALLGAGAARAQTPVDPDCVWLAAPADLKQQMRGQVAQHRDIIATLEQKHISDLMRTCHVSNTQNNTARIVGILRAKTLITHGEEGLKADLGLTPEALAVTWRRAPLNAKRVLPHALEEDFETPRDIAQSLDALGQVLRIASDQDRELFFDYAVGQSLMEQLGPR